MEYRRRRRGFKIPVTIGQYAENRRESFNRYEQKLLLLALTHRLCSVYTRKLIAEKTSVSHKHDIFIRLVQLIEQYYTKERGGLLRGQAMPVAQIPLRPLQIHLRIHGTGAGIQVHYPQKHFTTQEYTKERTGNLRFLQLPERILFRHFLQETDWNVATAIPQNVGNIISLLRFQSNNETAAFSQFTLNGQRAAMSFYKIFGYG